MTRAHATFLLVLLALACPAAARAQDLGGACSQQSLLRGTREITSTADGVTATFDKGVQLTCNDLQLSADSAKYETHKHTVTVFWLTVNGDTAHVHAKGNVVFIQQGNRIQADELDFDLKTKTGTFYVATGTVTLQPAAGTSPLAAKKLDRSLFGNTEPDAYFRGEKIDKLGPRTYRITHGAFTTCVQPTPRWEMIVGTETLTIDKHAVLHDVVLRVKDVPLLYVPALYLPLDSSGRATGILMPSYGHSTTRGFQLSDAFFWAIDRSEDATIYHDWFSQLGQGLGGDYEYISDPQSRGNAHAYFLHEKAFLGTSGVVIAPADNQFSVRGDVTQTLSPHVHLQAHVNYFSSVQTQQLLQQNVTDFTTYGRQVGANVYGQWGSYRISGQTDINDYFSGTAASRNGTAPTISFSMSPTPIAHSRITFGVSTDFAKVLRQLVVGDPTQDYGFFRYQLNPTIKAPIGNLSFLSLTTQASWHYTWWSQSADPNDSNAQLKVPVSRGYFDLQAGVSGPTFQRIFDTPGNGYAERFKHVIEPFATVHHYTNFTGFNQIVASERTQVGGYTKIDYGFSNRIIAKRKQPSGQAVGQTILSVDIDQSYYTFPLAAGYDPAYQSSEHGRAPSNFSPIAIVVNGQPTNDINGNLRIEYNWQFRAIDSISTGGGLSRRNVVTNVVYSRAFLVPGLLGFEDPKALGHSLSLNTNVKASDNHVGGTFSMSYNFTAGYALQKRISGYFNTQCCGVAMEFLSTNRGAAGPRGVPYEHLFTMSFTLAGLGTFANPLGSFLK